MRSYLGCLVVLCAVNLFARDPAHVTIYCNSLRFAPATGGPGQTDTLQLTTDSSFGEINQELAPLFDPTLPTHGAWFQLEDPTFPDAIAGQIAFDVPRPHDANGNGFDDFFEVTQPVAATTTQGAFTTPVDDGTVSATWSRAAGSPTGTCTLQLTGKTFGRLPDFTHTFELLEYTGTLNYVPSTNAMTGNLKLAQTGEPSNTLTGAVAFVREATNRFNQLTLQAAALTNATGQSLVYQLAPLERGQKLGANYFGFIDFADGDPTTSTADYRHWVLSIDDPNDTNGNGIPDLTDDVQPLDTQPTLNLIRSGAGLAFSIGAVLGSSVDLLEAVSVVQTNWPVVTSITLTNNPQILQLPVPDTKTRFWRLRTRF